MGLQGKCPGTLKMYRLMYIMQIRFMQRMWNHFYGKVSIKYEYYSACFLIRAHLHKPNLHYLHETTPYVSRPFGLDHLVYLMCFFVMGECTRDFNLNLPFSKDVGHFWLCYIRNNTQSWDTCH